MGLRRRMLTSDSQRLLILAKPQVIKGVYNGVTSRKGELWQMDPYSQFEFAVRKCVPK